MEPNKIVIEVIGEKALQSYLVVPKKDLTIKYSKMMIKNNIQNGESYEKDEENRKQVVCLGAGLEGLKLMEELQDAINKKLLDLTVIEENVQYSVYNNRSNEKSTVYYKNLKYDNVDFILDQVLKIDTKKRRIYTKTTQVKYDYLVIAMRSHFNTKEIKGLEQGSLNLYNEENWDIICNRIERMKEGKIIISSLDENALNPLLILESAFKIQEMVSSLNRSQDISIQFMTSSSSLDSGLGKSMEEHIDKRMQELNIKVITNCKLGGVDPKKRIIVYSSSEEEEAYDQYDLLLAAWPSSVPKILQRTSLTNDHDRLIINSSTLESENEKNIFVIGENADLLFKNALPKLPVLFSQQSISAAKNILNLIEGKELQNLNQGSYSFDVNLGHDSFLKVDLKLEPQSEDPLEVSVNLGKYDKTECNQVKEHLSKHFYDTPLPN